ncbi:periplasmic protease [Marinitoga piezophila KA3]|uniref:Periplasmic protease n=1 Tax=Marinitoga piezophila (strain DSM 14283 / JCM 11233 / KA3) TaxID=443254 RepID=H2J574_MARPK|nr:MULTISPECIES: S41 family peptidase [Marinitoga]AEX84932.1 periplasmic protease [Marinitoga piezophila KA3]APT75438.1 hypothetical protein LN42_02820 [Marinitoga sp. 1137]
MKNRIVVFYILFFFSTIFFGIEAINDNYRQSYDNRKILPIDTKVTPQQMKKDIDYLVNILKEVHPSTYSGFSDEQEKIIKNAYNKITQPMKVFDFYFILNEIICSIKDSHTHLVFPSLTNYIFYDFPIIWLNDGIYALDNIYELKKGDKILTINNKSSEEILKELRKIIPSENDFWIKQNARSILSSELYLGYLNLIDNGVIKLTIMRNNDIKTFNIKLQKYKGIHKQKSDWISYKIDISKNIGILKIKKCIYDEHYKEILFKFFKDVSLNNIKNIVVDLRYNLGGNSLVTDEFLKYIDIEKYKTYGAEIRFSKPVEKQRKIYGTGYKKYLPSIQLNEKIEDKSLLFKGKIYVLISGKTYSSGNWFAAVLGDNNIAMLVGEPTGNKPSHYGDILYFQTPEVGIPFTVSFKRFIRPDTSKNDEDALYPDITVFTTINDIINKRNPQLEKVIEIINSSQK